jgi:hypothetical protein
MGTILLIIGSFVAGGVVTYLFFRNNPKWKAKADKVADAGEVKLKERR